MSYNYKIDSAFNPLKFKHIQGVDLIDKIMIGGVNKQYVQPAPPPPPVVEEETPPLPPPPVEVVEEEETPPPPPPPVEEEETQPLPPPPVEMEEILLGVLGIPLPDDNEEMEEDEIMVGSF